MAKRKNYDRAYFDKWYRSSSHRVRTNAELVRQVSFVLHLTEFVLGRPVRSVLDVGCGEGQWRMILRRERPRLHYQGVDPSEYVVERFGVKRNIILGGIEVLDTLALRNSYDLVVCSGMLNYLSGAALATGVRHVATLTGGVAYLELFASEDQYEGDTNWPEPRSAGRYRRLMRDAGFIAIGMQCYVPERYGYRLSSLERV